MIALAPSSRPPLDQGYHVGLRGAPLRPRGPRQGVVALVFTRPSREQPVDLRPLSSRIVLVWSVDLPTRPAKAVSVGSAPAQNGIVCRSHTLEGATMDSRGGGTGGQRRRDHAAGEW